MAAMKVPLEKLVKKTRKGGADQVAGGKDRQTGQKARKASSLILDKNSEIKDEKKASVQNEVFDEEVHSKKGGKLRKDGSPSSMTVEQIQDLVAK